MTNGTPHIQPNGTKIAKTVLMPGDPLRAKYIADNFLENVEQFNEVRNMFGYTGTYKGKEISVMGSGMGIPSIGIYSYELYNFFDVDTIIRIGSCGALQENVNLYDVIIAQAASTNSNYVDQFNIPGHFAPIADFELITKAKQVADDIGAVTHVGNILSSDTFYNADKHFNDSWKNMGILGIEMESAGLYLNAIHAGKKALGIFTVSDHILRDEATSAEERQTSFTQMMEIALEIAE
ncbi:MULTISPECIES: purine-nucleoside phosphorylase [Staphylococcus]|mgnify:FL=1|jgi:purine-nucleoside phosphorylase|uniref:Purine nucleoside phosphorylase DeoD-type n=1 Tax=Staphylococcus hominis TaxID=1290 RepID=A0A8X8KJI8_STAHO|nr:MULTISPECIES: purine-nucleoside phosphorylase [Staphylococcus]EUZ66254.1 purine nucleoside phosphorylase [Staphylococcus sp. M0480]OFK81313.1 purine-nucleoside phosphorylase [Staphylococcus sp. HMSC057A02]OFM63245.1 purine-nucleoside phosphorylase [Staphylococcus sp. HMSC068D07]OFM65160.1 purine-nucleoside phosphorylase [Staphylococcus sp. HMSC062C01]OFM74806.1 purine-nucleoside phosphorylase [Staphylococcus sp. HMSC074B09]OFM91219.1 purine-nucleoside phosphorylase [Staphylococcus sp. HMSC